MQVKILSSAAAYSTLRDTWNSLVQDAPADLFGLDMTSSFEWFEAILTAFPEAAESRVVVAYDNGAVVGLLPIIINRTGKLGPRLLVPTELYGGRNGPLLRKLDRNVLIALLKGLDEACPSWSSLQLTIVVHSGQARIVNDACSYAGYRTSLAGVQQSPFFPISNDQTTLWNGMGKGIRRDIRSSEKKLAEKGTVTFQVIDKAEDAERLIQTILAIEEKSWKHKAGSAITNHPRQERFYREMFPRALGAGWLHTRLLILNDQPIAYLMGIKGDRVFCDLKNSYVDEFASFAPSHIVLHRELLDLGESGICTYDFMGKIEPYKLRWAPGTRIYTRQTIRIYSRRSNGWLSFQWQKLKARIKCMTAKDSTDTGDSFDAKQGRHKTTTVN